VCRIYYLAFYTNRSLRHTVVSTASKCRLANQACALPARAPKPYLSRTGRGKGRAGGVVGGKIGGKKGRSSGSGGAKASGVAAASI
jgi:hypothetical protein